MDRLPWSPFHTRLVIALGVTWVLDGLEVTLASLIAPVLQSERTLHLSNVQIGTTASVYLLGEVAGALFFGHLADRLGRRRLFLATLTLYLAANALTALALGYATLLFFRFFAGAGIGGEYAAINSAIDELIPARYRGHTDLAINGTYWLGALIGALAERVLLDPHVLPIDVGWRVGLLMGPLIGLGIWAMRRALPESPRWLLMRGRSEEAERSVDTIERELAARGYVLPPVDPSRALTVRATEPMGYGTLAALLLRRYPSRSVLGLALMSTQSFLYNAIFFTYGLVLTHFYGVVPSHVPSYFYAFAVGNLLGPLTLGRLFDTIGRRQMISATYALSGILLGISGWLFSAGALTATSQAICWSLTFFVGSAAASSAYLTVSEIFPLEVRSQALALFFAVAQVVGATGPLIFGSLIGDREHPNAMGLLTGYALGAAMMIAGGVVGAVFGVRAERTALEDVAEPLSSASDGRGPSVRH
jgi:MFS family permease